MLPIIQREIADKRRWISSDEMADMVSLAGAAPGGVGVNAAAYIGYRMARLAGAVATVAGMVIPGYRFYNRHHAHINLNCCFIDNRVHAAAA